MTPAEQAELGGSYSTYVNNAAKTIAADIVDKVVEKTFNTHFVRTKEDADNPYRVIFYDYRDDGVRRQVHYQEKFWKM